MKALLESAARAKGAQMQEPLEQLVLSAATLRTAIRAKLRTGTSRQAISALIKTYAPEGANTERRNGRLYRLPVELIALERRAPFLDALNELPADRDKDRSSRLTMLSTAGC